MELRDSAMLVCGALIGSSLLILAIVIAIASAMNGDD